MEGDIRRAGGVGRFQQARGQPGEELPAPLGAGRRDVTVVPAADGLGHLGRLREPHAGKGRQGLRIVVDPGEDQAAEAG